MNDYDEELLPQMSSAQRQNRLLIEDPDDAYIGGGRPYGGGDQLLPLPGSQGRANARPLIEEEEKEAPQSSSALTDRGKANLAAYMYHQNKARGLQQPKKPWKRGMPYSQATLNTFDKSTPYEKKMFGGISNPQQAANLDAHGGTRPGAKGFWGRLGDILTGGGTFQKLFGDRITPERAEKRQEWKDKRQEIIKANGGKRTWMQKLFGAYKNPSQSAKALGIKSRNAPYGESSGWADQLIEANKSGRLDESHDAKDAFESQQLVAAPQGQQAAAADRSFETASDNEDKQLGANAKDDVSSIDQEEEEKEPADLPPTKTKYYKNDGESSDEEDEFDEEKEDAPTQFQNFLFQQVMSNKLKNASFKEQDDD